MSNRTFRLVGFEYNQLGFLNIEISLDEIYMNKGELKDSELIYSLQEKLDTILNLEVNDTEFIYINRDNKKSKAVIIRKR